MFDFTVSTSMWPFQYFHNVSATNLILIAVQRNGILIFAALLQSGRFAFDHFTMHAQDMEIFALQTNDDTNVLRTVIKQ